MTKRSCLLTGLLAFGGVSLLILPLPSRTKDAVAGAARPAPEQAAKSVPPSVTMESLSRVPLAFTENYGQWDERVRFRTSTEGATIWFCRDGITYEFTHRVPHLKTGGNDPMAAGIYPVASFDRTIPDSIESVGIRATFVGANPEVELVGEGQSGYRCNYFIGKDPAKWRTDVPNYAAVVYRNAYPGIDVYFEGEGDRLRTRLEAKPGIDLSAVRFLCKGSDAVTGIGSSRFRVETPWGAVLELLATDQSAVPNTSAPIGASPAGEEAIADISLAYSTYLGGAGAEGGYDIAVDRTGGAYVTGYSLSSDFPTQDGYDPTFNGGFDAFVTKLTLVCPRFR